MARARDLRAAMNEARSFREWREAAERWDAQRGLDAWREDDDSPLYDAALLRQHTGQLDGLRGGPVPPQISLLRATLQRHLFVMREPALHRVALAGTKRVIERWLDAIEASLLALARVDDPAFPAEERLRLFQEGQKVYGHSALMLSGGATLGFYHLGVVKALSSEGLLPRVISGSSTGAMIAAGVCTRDDDELARMFEDPDEIALAGLERVGLRRALRQRALLDPETLHGVLLNNVGEHSFAEAYAHSGRVLNVSVSPVHHRQRPRLLNHLTAPDVLVPSAALASSALPGFFPPSPLQVRGPDGRPVPEDPEERWIDGSVHGDLPKVRLARLHHVNHFIASQTNPHILPFLTDPRRRGLLPFAVGLAASTLHGQGVYLSNLARQLAEPTPLRPWADQLHALVAQDFRGDIDISPRFHPSAYLKVVSNPSREDLDWFIREGERATWPLVPMIRDQTRVGRAFEVCIDALEAEVGGDVRPPGGAWPPPGTPAAEAPL